MKLEITHVTPYLPFDLKLSVHLVGDEYWTEILRGINRNTLLIGGNRIDVLPFTLPDLRIKPILKPLSDFNDVFTDLFDDDLDVRTFTNEDFLGEHGFGSMQELQEMKIEWYPVGLFNLLVKHHFDVFGLIEKDLAVNMNKLSLAAL